MIAIIAAAKVGSLPNNTFRAKFLYQNLSIQNNLIHGSYLSGVKNLIFLGSSCIYRNFQNSDKEDYLLSGKLEPTNEPYAIAIADSNYMKIIIFNMEQITNV